MTKEIKNELVCEYHIWNNYMIMVPNEDNYNAKYNNNNDNNNNDYNNNSTTRYLS